MARFALPTELPIVQAPMAGGPSTIELAVAVADAGGYPFVAGGYLSAAQLSAQLKDVRARTPAPFGVNLFVPSEPSDRAPIEAYRAQLQADARRVGTDLGDAHWDDDHYAEKVDALVTDPPHLVTFTFGAPSRDDVERLHRAGAFVGVSVTSGDEARHAAAAGADVLAVQGSEAGGHQATFSGGRANRLPLLDALAQIGGTGLPMIAAGGIMSAAHARRALDAGATAVQIGTALLCTPEAGTNQTYRDALLGGKFTETVVTRAYSGRYARGLCNRFAREHPDAPDAYPEIHHLTRPLRAAAAAAGDADVPNLWAGTGWTDITVGPAREVVRRIAEV
jgi:nitronate monooxygenase